MPVRKAEEKDLDAVAAIYEKILTEEENGMCSIGWKRGIYPTRKTAETALAQKDLFVLEEDGRILAAMRLNREQVPEYANVRWKYEASPERIMVMHTLVVDPDEKGRGCGGRMIRFYENYAYEQSCPHLRIDTNQKNTVARAMYRHLGYREAGITPCVFNGIEGVELVCLEKNLNANRKESG